MSPTVDGRKYAWWREMSSYHWFVFSVASMGWMFDTMAQQLFNLARKPAMKELLGAGAICAGVGFAPGSMAFAALKDRAQQVNQSAFGHRFLFGSVCVGRGAVELDASSTDSARGAIRELHADAAAAWRELEFAGSVQARLDGVGVLSHSDAQRLGAVRPAARAAGIREDARGTSPRPAYDRFTTSE